MAEILVRRSLFLEIKQGDVSAFHHENLRNVTKGDRVGWISVKARRRRSARRGRVGYQPLSPSQGGKAASALSGSSFRTSIEDTRK